MSRLPEMTSPAHRIQYSWEDYLALEASSNVKHEFLEGQIYGVAGGTPEHAALKAAVTGLLFAQIRGSRCRAHDADLRVRVLGTGLATYPDVTVVCGPSERDPNAARFAHAGELAAGRGFGRGQLAHTATGQDADRDRERGPP